MNISLPNSLCSLVASGRLSKQSVESRPSLLVLRHSDRPALPPRSAGGELSLTEDGKARARQLGVCLGSLGISPGAVLMTTPMTRTAQTLLSVLSGANWHQRMESIEVSVRAFGIGSLFERNFHIDDVIGKFTSGNHSGGGPHSTVDICHIFNGLSCGRIQFPGVKPFSQAACSQMRMLKELLDRQKEKTSPRGLSILLVHDLNLAFLLAHYFDMKNFTPETWPPFLDALLIQSDEEDGKERVTAFYGDKVMEIDLTKDESG